MRDLIIPWRFAVRMKQNMGMRLDETRKQRHSRQVDGTRAGRNSYTRNCSGSLDLLAADDNHPVFTDGFSIEDARRAQNRQLRTRRLAGNMSSNQGEEDCADAANHTGDAAHNASLYNRFTREDSIQMKSAARSA